MHAEGLPYLVKFKMFVETVSYFQEVCWLVGCFKFVSIHQNMDDTDGLLCGFS